MDAHCVGRAFALMASIGEMLANDALRPSDRALDVVNTEVRARSL